MFGGQVGMQRQAQTAAQPVNMAVMHNSIRVEGIATSIGVSAVVGRNEHQKQLQRRWGRCAGGSTCMSRVEGQEGCMLGCMLHGLIHPMALQQQQQQQAAAAEA
jgi:hypothetical protein